MSEPTESEEFDFGTHAQKAVERYRTVRPDYELLAEVAKRLLIEMLRASDIRPHSVEARAKSLESFAKKVAKPSEADPRKPKYMDPLSFAEHSGKTRLTLTIETTLATAASGFESQ